MSGKIELLKKHKLDIIFFITFCIIEVFIVNNVTLLIIAIVIQTILLFVILNSIDKKDNDLKCIISSYSFLLSYIQNVEDNKGSKASYDIASRYLIGYQQVNPYEEIDENNNLKLYKFQKYFNFIISSDKKNEVHLLSYRQLIENIESELNFDDKYNKKISQITLISKLIILILELLLLVIKLYFKSEVNEINTSILLSYISLFITIPLFYLAVLFVYKGRVEYVKKDI